MKKILVLILFAWHISFVFAQFKLNDTTFLVREVIDSATMLKKTGFGYNYYHAIYFERNKNAKEYKWITDFSFDKFYGKQEYQRDIKSLKMILHKRLKRISMKELPTKWCTLYSLKDTFYVYSPSEYCWNYQFTITDSVVIDKSCEPTFSAIDTIIKKSKTLYQLKVKSINYLSTHNEIFNRIINIYIIDKQKGIAVFEDDYSGKKKYSLMVEASRVNSFPLIVNYCKTDKQFEEFEFDKIDYSSLIKKSQFQ